MTLKGRHWVALWLLAFLASAGLVVARQTAGYRAARALAATRETRAALEGRRAEFERRIRTAQSRGVLLPRARARLGLRLPADSEIILFPVPADPPAPPPLPPPPTPR